MHSPPSSSDHAYTFATLDDRLDRYTDLKAQGLEPLVPIQHGVTTSIYYRDPDGNFVEMRVDNFPDVDDATAYMTGPELEEDRSAFPSSRTVPQAWMSNDHDGMGR